MSSLLDRHRNWQGRLVLGGTAVFALFFCVRFVAHLGDVLFFDGYKMRPPLHHALLVGFFGFCGLPYFGLWLLWTVYPNHFIENRIVSWTPNYRRAFLAFLVVLSVTAVLPDAISLLRMLGDPQH